MPVRKDIMLVWYGLFIDGYLWYVFHSKDAAEERMSTIFSRGKKEIIQVRIGYTKFFND